LKNTSSNLLPPAFALELLVDAEEELEHRAAAHRSGFVGVAAKTHCDGAAWHGAQAVTDLFGRSNPFAGCDGVLDTWQLLDEAPAAGDHERIVADLARRGLDNPTTVA
jgi:hypothetical protein